MKYFSSTILLLSLILFFSCSSEDDDQMNISEDFVLQGTWFLDKVVGMNLLETCTAEGEDEVQGFITFNEDGTGDASFFFQLCDYPEANFQETTITYVEDENTPDVITVTFADGQVFDWTLSEGTVNSVVASFNYVVVETTIFMSR